MKKILLALFVGSVVIFSALRADAVLIDFETLTLGQIVDDEFASLGLNISANNPNRSVDEAIIFDSDAPTGGDGDLGFAWDGGNLFGTPLGNILIIAEDTVDTSPNDGFVDDPDDEGQRPAGSITFLFDHEIDLFGFDFVDVDNQANGGEAPASYILEFKKGGGLVGSVSLADLALLDGSIVHDDNFANTYPDIRSFDLGDTFDEVVVNFAGSGGIDNIRYNVVPEPATLILFGSGMAGAFLRRRKVS